MAYYVDDRDNTIIRTDDVEAALAVALELAERDGLSIEMYSDAENGELVQVSAFRRAYLDALETGEGREDFGTAPLYRGDVMNQENETDEYDETKVYDSDSGTELPPWREQVRWFFLG